MFALALLLLLALALALVLVLVVVVATAYTFSRFCDPKNRQIGGVFTLEAKNTVNTDVFSASEAQNHGIYDVFGLWLHKSRYLQCFLASA